jgi:hypothetical protein
VLFTSEKGKKPAAGVSLEEVVSAQDAMEEEIADIRQSVSDELVVLSNVFGEISNHIRGLYSLIASIFEIFEQSIGLKWTGENPSVSIRKTSEDAYVGYASDEVYYNKWLNEEGGEFNLGDYAELKREEAKKALDEAKQKTKEKG